MDKKSSTMEDVELINQHQVVRKVSICIPTYNNIDDLKRLLNSILIQNYKFIEIVISDNSDNVEIEEYIKEFTQRYAAIEVIYSRNNINIGAINNINKSIKMATGYYVKPMFSDDWFQYENTLSKLVSLLVNSNSDFVFCGTLQVSESNKYRRSISDKDIELFEKDYRNIFCTNFIGAPSAVIFKRGDILLDKELIWLVDVDFYLSLIASGYKCHFTKEDLICIGIHENQITSRFASNSEKIASEYGYVYGKHNLSSESKFRIFISQIEYRYNKKVIKPQMDQRHFYEYLYGCYKEIRTQKAYNKTKSRSK